MWDNGRVFNCVGVQALRRCLRNCASVQVIEIAGVQVQSAQVFKDFDLFGNCLFLGQPKDYDLFWAHREVNFAGDEITFSVVSVSYGWLKKNLWIISNLTMDIRPKVLLLSIFFKSWGNLLMSNSTHLSFCDLHIKISSWGSRYTQSEVKQ